MRIHIFIPNRRHTNLCLCCRAEWLLRTCVLWILQENVNQKHTKKKTTNKCENVSAHTPHTVLVRVPLVFYCVFDYGAMGAVVAVYSSTLSACMWCWVCVCVCECALGSSGSPYARGGSSIYIAASHKYTWIFFIGTVTPSTLASYNLASYICISMHMISTRMGVLFAREKHTRRPAHIYNVNWFTTTMNDCSRRRVDDVEISNKFIFTSTANRCWHLCAMAYDTWARNHPISPR